MSTSGIHKLIDPLKDLYEESIYNLSIPSLFALHSLLNRGWEPQTISFEVLYLLFSFLSNLDYTTINCQERIQVR